LLPRQDHYSSTIGLLAALGPEHGHANCHFATDSKNAEATQNYTALTQKADGKRMCVDAMQE
jgi:hypothetical protein